MFNPISTYRIQFNKGFTFKDFLPVISYLHDLGIKTIYASPIYKAVPNSNHGYDVTDPNQINPEIGTLEELQEISVLLKSYGMFWIQDIVPNHMGFHQDNLWLMDVLQNGEASAYRQYFDIQSADLATDPLMVPFLGDDLETVLANGELQLADDQDEKKLKYFDSYWPLNAGSAARSKDTISDLAATQYYRLCSYRETNTKINYRRFFTVNSLICLNMQHPRVFEDYHRLTKSLLDQGIFHGLRIDHVDGLADPTEYLNRLRNLCGEDTYIVVEKILEPGEELPRIWPVQGTTGYDYLGLAGQLFVNQKAEDKFDAFYKDLSKFKRPLHDQILKRKRAFLDQFMQGELDNLYQLFLALKLADSPLKGSNAEKNEHILPFFKPLIAELLVRLTVYRLYPGHYPLSEQDASVLQSIFQELGKNDEYTEALPIFRHLILGEGATAARDEPAMIFFRRLMQFTGPLMAKGVEDTLMYRYNRFIGNNEVGDSPELFGIAADDFHQQIALRAQRWPMAMNASATHDTKRGEDARTRLAVLTDMRSEWLKEVSEWQQLNKGIKSAGAPDANDEYFIYQTLIATCPEQGFTEDDYEQRLLEYIEKALRESKRNSGWDEPDLEYEERTKDFIQYLLDPQREFWPKFFAFLKKVAEFGKLASLTGLVLKHTLPGIPDTYQGTELWDLSMVDPDNRRPVDYQLRIELLSKPNAKLGLLRSLLQLRNHNIELFLNGRYLPLQVKGKYASSVIAFARQYQKEWLIVCSVINLASLISKVSLLKDLDWEDTHIMLPPPLSSASIKYAMDEGTEDAPEIKTSDKGSLAISGLFTTLPFTVLRTTLVKKRRGAGLLMHVSSLPSAYGIGDFGPSASSFLSFLSDSDLKYWQVLPMNPLSADQAYSPYSATSVMAGNTLLISPESLAESGLLSVSDLEDHKRKIKRKISFSKVTELKTGLLKKAYRNWKQDEAAISKPEFHTFCQEESSWLDDYALFSLISTLQENKPWFRWPQKLQKRNKDALKNISEKHADSLEEIRWQQFIFFRQWAALKQQANLLGIQIIGDLPFYTAHNSADVWASPGQFAIGADGQVTGMAGVPPDYFNADGQLWGMPVYNWKAMSRRRYRWWISRIRMNLKIYDQVRLDHFRAFSEYWEVPFGSESAKSGKWKPGPGATFFKALRSAIGELPLIAEDLGEISAEVYQLRDEFKLPGMKVLQFAFDKDGSSIHAPHNFEHSNFVVYTGTHDNNTTRGWYEDEADAQTRETIEHYLGMKLSSHNIAEQVIRLALSSIADIAIIPVQDILNKPAKARMNTPASVDGNWSWRLKANELTPNLSGKIYGWLRTYAR
jgi:malto-oligosyltrehalose synthase/4-alpha-glucanotransferase